MGVEILEVNANQFLLYVKIPPVKCFVKAHVVSIQTVQLLGMHETSVIRDLLN